MGKPYTSILEEALFNETLVTSGSIEKVIAAPIVPKPGSTYLMRLMNTFGENNRVVQAVLRYIGR